MDVASIPTRLRLVGGHNVFLGLVGDEVTCVSNPLFALVFESRQAAEAEAGQQQAAFGRVFQAEDAQGLRPTPNIPGFQERRPSPVVAVPT